MQQAKEWVSGKPEYFHKITKYKKTPQDNSTVSRTQKQTQTQKQTAGVHSAYHPQQVMIYAYSYPQGMAMMSPYPQGVVTMDGLIGVIPPAIRMPQAVLASTRPQQPSGAKV